jgi:hypothetical protein
MQTADLTAPIPQRLKSGMGLFAALIVLVVLIGGFGLSRPRIDFLVWFAAIGGVFGCILLVFMLWQIPAYRNPVLQFRPDTLVFYGIPIPWTAITNVYVGTVKTVNLTLQATGVEGALMPEERAWIGVSSRDQLRASDLSRSFMQRYARLMLGRENGKLLLPVVRERTVSELAAEINEKISSL